ncbi:hypothetical protein MHYP_G00024810 [Metynnis hypsauchen]
MLARVAVTSGRAVAESQGALEVWALFPMGESAIMGEAQHVASKLVCGSPGVHRWGEGTMAFCGMCKVTVGFGDENESSSRGFLAKFCFLFFLTR